jgi:hypothetical protein
MAVVAAERPVDTFGRRAFACVAARAFLVGTAQFRFKIFLDSITMLFAGITIILSLISRVWRTMR